MSENNISNDTSTVETASKPKRVKKEKTEEAPKKTPHLSKVEKFMASLPKLSEEASELFNVARGLSTADIGTLMAHLQAETRVRGVEASATAKGHAVNQTVRAVSGPTKYLGLEGVVTKSQRIRCYVKFEGMEKEGYFFHSDLEATGEIISAPEPTETLVEVPEDETVADSTNEVEATGTDG